MTSIRTLIVGLALIVIACSSSDAVAATIWNENTQGDLSDNRLTPTTGTLAVGSNDLFGQTQGGDLDYLTFALPAGHQLTGIFLRSYQSNDGTAFVAMQNGSTFTESDSNPNPANMRGYSHFGDGNVNSNLLSALGGTAQGANSYTLWLQQLGTPDVVPHGFRRCARAGDAGACGRRIAGAGILAVDSGALKSRRLRIIVQAEAAGAIDVGNYLGGVVHVDDVVVTMPLYQADDADAVGFEMRGDALAETIGRRLGNKFHGNCFAE